MVTEMSLFDFLSYTVLYNALIYIAVKYSVIETFFCLQTHFQKS